MADVRLQGVEKAYGDIRILHGIDLEIRDGEFMVGSPGTELEFAL